MLALAPGVGDVDLVVASELLEAGRAIANGFVTTDRTLLIASVSRVYLTVEKMQMADGRYDSERLLKAAEQNAQQSILFDMETAAKQAGAIVNAVMLGAIAGSGRLPVPVEAFEAAIKHDGKAVEANLRGFKVGLAAAREQLHRRAAAFGQARREADARARSKRRLPRCQNRHARSPPKACAASSPIRMPITRGSISIASSRSPSQNSSPRPRGISRCACRSRT